MCEKPYEIRFGSVATAHILHSIKKKPQEPGASESEYGKAIFGGESGIRTHGAFPHHQFSRLAP